MHSMGLALILSFCSILICFVCMEYLTTSLYEKVMNWYSSDATAGIWMMVFFVIQFLLHTFWIFMKMMNEITNAITGISDGVHCISNGNLDTRIDENFNNELGNLAQDINLMAGSIAQSKEKEKQWNQERYNMITNMSHDLKTPMLSIIGYTDLIQNRKYKDEEELNHYCKIVSDKTKDLNTVVNQLFQLSKINSSDFLVKREQINLLEFTQQILMTFMPQLIKEEIDYTMDIPMNLQLNTDPAMMRHIFDNLISNTLKYAAGGHYLQMYARQDELGTRIELVNHGPMIPKDELEDIFIRFYREKKNHQKEGSGCGLYIVKQMSELLGGSITVQSSEKETRFILRLMNRYPMRKGEML
jgi:signal transduction histidine kinase